MCVDVVAECDRYAGERWLAESLMREGGVVGSAPLFFFLYIP